MAYGEQTTDENPYTTEYTNFMKRFEFFPKKNRLTYSAASSMWDKYQSFIQEEKASGNQYPFKTAHDRFMNFYRAQNKDGGVYVEGLKHVKKFKAQKKEDMVYVYDQKLLAQVEEDFEQISEMFDRKSLHTFRPLDTVEMESEKVMHT